MLPAATRKRPRSASPPLPSLPPVPAPSPPSPFAFDDPSTSDVVLRLVADQPPSHLDLHLHSSALQRSPFFSVLLSDRWRPSPSSSPSSSLPRFELLVPPSSDDRPFDAHLAVLRLLYTIDFPSSILSVPDALALLPVAHSLLFDDLVHACVRFLEAVPWSSDEEDHVRRLSPLLPPHLSTPLLARLHPPPDPPSEEMLLGLVHSAINTHPSAPSVKSFVTRLLRDFAPREPVRRVLSRAFSETLEAVRLLLAEYASPDFRIAVDNEETEAIQRLNLHKALVNARKLLWLVERMIELRVADAAVAEWSNQEALALDLEKAFRDETCRNIAPALPAFVMKCTSRLANAVAAGSILASRQVRMKLVKDWLPVLNVCRDTVSPIHSGQKLLCQELEETFLKIISTLPMSDSCKLLQQCLSFSTRNIDECTHLMYAFNTWFRRASQPPPTDGSID